MRRVRLGMGDVAEMVREATGDRSVTSQDVLRILKRHSAVRLEIGPGCRKGRYYTSHAQLREALPELWDQIQRERAVVSEV